MQLSVYGRRRDVEIWLQLFLTLALEVVGQLEAAAALFQQKDPPGTLVGTTTGLHVFEKKKYVALSGT